MMHRVSCTVPRKLSTRSRRRILPFAGLCCSMRRSSASGAAPRSCRWLTRRRSQWGPSPRSSPRRGAMASVGTCTTSPPDRPTMMNIASFPRRRPPTRPAPVPTALLFPRLWTVTVRHTRSATTLSRLRLPTRRPRYLRATRSPSLRLHTAAPPTPPRHSAHRGDQMHAPPPLLPLALDATIETVVSPPTQATAVTTAATAAAVVSAWKVAAKTCARYSTPSSRPRCGRR